MSYVSPAIKGRFESLPIEVKNAILEQNVSINTMNDLIHALEYIVENKEKYE